MSIEIPRKVHENELLVRAIFHPVYCSSKGKLKPNAFLPAADKNDVSLLRLHYTDADTCKRHALTIHKPVTNAYSGLAVIRNSSVQTADRLNEAVSFYIKGTPIDEHNEYVPDGIVVYTDDPGLPMHADLLYNRALQKGVPNQAVQIAARGLSETANYIIDKNTDSPKWEGGELTDVKKED